jgi:glycosyltransferase involved in cell wall biosynthesis
MLPTVIVACARRVAQYHRSLGYQGKMVVIPNGLDLSSYRSDSANAASLREALGLGDAFVVCHVGRADTQKDHATLLTAFKLFLAKHPGSRLLLIGAGLEEKSVYLSRVNDYSTIKTNVLALGPRQDVPAMMQLSDVFGLSSVSEGFPNVVAEAMASGVPCVVTDCGDAAEMVGDTGWTVPVKDAKAMASAFSEAATESQTQRMRRKQAARSRAEQMFDLRSMVYAYQCVWLEMVE